MQTEPIRVLVADDHTSVRQMLRWLLEGDGRFTVAAEASDGSQAIASSAGVDLALLDIAMPHVDGLFALSEIKSARPDLPVVIVSAYAPPYLRSEAARRGAALVVDKADGLGDLPDRLAGLLGLRHSSDA